MALIADIINKVCGAGSNALGMNLTKGLLQFFVKTRKVLLIKPGTVFDPAREWGEEYMKELQIDGKILVIDKIARIEQVGNEDNIDTKEDGTEIVTNLGKYKFAIYFNDGLYRDTQMESVSGFGRFNIAMVDDQGNFLFTKSSNGGFKGYTVGQIQKAKYKFQTNTVGEESGLMFQFLDRAEFDKDKVFIPECEYTGESRLIEGVSQANIKFVNTPADGETTITFDIVLDQDQVTAVEGLTVADVVRFRNNGVAEAITPTAVVGEPQRYTATVTALSTSDSVDLTIYNSTDGKSVIERDGMLLKSAVSSTLVV